jgi:hypothetical protein
VIAEAALVLMVVLGFEAVALEGFVVCGPVGSVDDVGGRFKDALIPDGVGIGDELRVRSVVERRAFNCTIYK